MSHVIRKTPRRIGASRRLRLESLEARLCLSTYTTIDLIPLAGHDYSVALGLNDNGLAVGRSHSPDGEENAAVVWSVDPLGGVSVYPLPGIDGDPYAGLQSMEVNNDGMIVGESWVPSENPEDPNSKSYVHGVVWTGDPGSSVVHDLPPLGETADGNFQWSTARSISERDPNGNFWVVGTSTDAFADPQVHHGVLWQVDSAGNVLSTTDLQKDSNNVDPNDVKVIGNSVFVVGDFYVEIPEGGFIAQTCIWETELDGNVVMRTDLPPFTGDSVITDFQAVSAIALNNDLDVVGWGYNSALERNGFFCETHDLDPADLAPTDLGSLGNQGSRAAGINDNDVIVGRYYDVTPPDSPLVGDEHAFVWENSVMHTLLDQVSDRTFWRLFSAFDVNNHGEIVGTGRAGKRNDSEQHGFLARPEGGTELHPPVANDDSYSVLPGTTLAVTAPGVLGNDTDADGDSLTAALDAGASNGTLSLNGDGSFSYTPNSGFTGEDSFTYVANDGLADSNVAAVTIQVTSEPTTSMHVGDLDGSVVDLGRFWQADVTIAVVDQAGTPVANATVNGTWSGDTSGSASAVTDPAGLVTVSSDKILDKKDTAIFTVDSVVHGSLEYDPTANTDPDGDSEGTSIVVYQGGTTAAPASTASAYESKASGTLTSATTSGTTEEPAVFHTRYIRQHTASAEEAIDEPNSVLAVDEAITELDLDSLDDDLVEDLALAVL